jgi:hypothetical protein
LEIGNTTIENCSVKCGFSIDHAGKQWWPCSETQWRWRGWLAQFITSWSAVWGIPDMWQCSQGLWSPKCQHLSRSEEEIAEHKATFLDAPKGLEAARKDICQFDTKHSIIVMCNKVENALYRLRSWEKRKKDLLNG